MPSFDALRRIALLVVVLMSVPVPPVQAQMTSEVHPEAQQMRRARWLNSGDQLLVAPYYSVAAGRGARLILVNRFAEAIDYEVRALAPSGLAFPLGADSLPSRGVVEIDLTEALEAAPRPFEEGSVEIRYFGDADMAQAWLVLSGPGGSLETPLIVASTSTAREWVSFWDGPPLGWDGLLTPRFSFHNSGSRPVNLSLSWTQADGEARTTTKGLGGFQAVTVAPPGASPAWVSGSLIVRHDGEAGQVVVAGHMFSGGAPVSALATATPAEMDANRSLEGLGFPDLEGARVILSAHDARAIGDPRVVDLSLLHRKTGDFYTSAQLSLLPGEIRRTDLSSLLPEDATVALHDLRLRVTSEEGNLLVSCVSVAPDGTIVDTPLIPAAKIHASGTYPIPATETHSVSTTFLNLGDETAQLFGHFVSGRGEYALEPIEVLPGAAYVLEFQTLFEQEPIDRLGRRLHPDIEWGFFQWFSRRGSRQLIARTELRKKGGSDTIGFNCFGCCAEFPSGAVIPESIAFDISETPSFEAVEYVDTCAGRMGPYYAYPNTLTFSAPVTWDGQAISTTDYTNQDVTFQGSGQYTRINCETIQRNFFGGGNATSDRCLKKHHPEFNPKRSCGDQTPNCSACFTCCDKQKAVGDCRCAFLGSPTSCTEGVRAGCQQCKKVCVGTHAVTCDQQVVDCP